jgi:diguanylate cyclase (GGDEF)-like protein
MRLLFRVTIVAAVAAAPLVGQTSPAARWVAEAERLEDTDATAALALVRRALPLLAAPADAPLRMRALSTRCWTSAEAAPDSLPAYAAEGVREASRAGDAMALARLRVCRGYGLESAGEPAEAMRDYDFGVAEGRRLGTRDLVAGALLLRGQLHYYRGDFTTAVADLDESYRVWTALGKGAQQRGALNAIANLYADSRVAQYDRALDYYRQVLASNLAAGSERGVATGHFNVASTLERMGRLDEALAQYRRGLAMDVRRGDSAEVAVDRRAVAIVLYKLGRPGEALALLDRVAAYAAESGNAELAAQTRLSRGVSLRMLGRHAEALGELERARARFAATGNDRFLEKVHEERALAFAASGAWRAAFEARGEQMALRRSLEAGADQERSSRLRARFDADKKEAENRALMRENALRREALAAGARVRRLQVVVLVLSAFVIGGLVLLVARQLARARGLRATALTDALTGLPNRRHLDLLGDAAARAARSRGGGFAVLGVDVDHFKRINDRFGHQAGDAVLRRVAGAARGALREGDHLGRAGGEEFVAVLPATGASGAAPVAERLRAAVESADFSDLAPGLTVTVSVGIAAWDPADDGFAESCRRADEALYRAKAAGRNRVETAAREDAVAPVA